MSQNSQCFKSRKHKVIGGVCSGIALSKGWSVSLTRFTTLLVACATGLGILLYFLFWMMLPKWDAAVAGPEPETLPHDLLLRDPKNKIIGGVCGAIATYFGWDPAMVRIGFALIILLGGIGLVPYLYAWIVIPYKTPSSAVV